MEDKFLFEAVDMDDSMVYVPLGESAGMVDGVLVVDKDATDLMESLDQGMIQMDLIQLLCNLCTGDNQGAKMVKMEATQLEVIRDLCEKARTGNCSQYTYQNLMNQLYDVI